MVVFSSCGQGHYKGAGITIFALTIASLITNIQEVLVPLTVDRNPR